MKNVTVNLNDSILNPRRNPGKHIDKCWILMSLSWLKVDRDCHFDWLYFKNIDIELLSFILNFFWLIDCWQLYILSQFNVVVLIDLIDEFLEV